MKTEVYTWRVSPELKTRLEREARRRKISVSAALNAAECEWLQKSAAERDGDEEQRRLQLGASKWVGTLASGNAKRSESATSAVRNRLRRKHGR